MKRNKDSIILVLINKETGEKEVIKYEWIKYHKCR